MPNIISSMDRSVSIVVKDKKQVTIFNAGRSGAWRSGLIRTADMHVCHPRQDFENLLVRLRMYGIDSLPVAFHDIVLDVTVPFSQKVNK